MKLMQFLKILLNESDMIKNMQTSKERHQTLLRSKIILQVKEIVPIKTIQKVLSLIKSTVTSIMFKMRSLRKRLKMPKSMLVNW